MSKRPLGILIEPEKFSFSDISKEENDTLIVEKTTGKNMKKIKKTPIISLSDMNITKICEDDKKVCITLDLDLKKDRHVFAMFLEIDSGTKEILETTKGAMKAMLFSSGLYVDPTEYEETPITREKNYQEKEEKEEIEKENPDETDDEDGIDIGDEDEDGIDLGDEDEEIDLGDEEKEEERDENDLEEITLYKYPPYIRIFVEKKGTTFFTELTGKVSKIAISTLSAHISEGDKVNLRLIYNAYEKDDYPGFTLNSVIRKEVRF
jgi:hypothetical protein